MCLCLQSLLSNIFCTKRQGTHSARCCCCCCCCCCRCRCRCSCRCSCRCRCRWRCHSRSGTLRHNHPKNRVFSAIFVPLEEKMLVFTMFLQHQGQNQPKTPLFTVFFDERVENTVFCDVFVTRRLKCIANTSVFFTFTTSSSQSKPSKNTGICSVLTRQNAKKIRCLEAIVCDFSKCCKLQSFMNVPCILPAKKVAPPLKNCTSVLPIGRDN